MLDTYKSDWTGPNSFTSSLQNPIIANADVTHTGVYEVFVTLESGCSTGSEVFVYVNDREAEINWSSVSCHH